MRNRTILNRANKILEQLQKLQTKTEQLLRDAKYYESEEHDDHIEDVLVTLDGLASFDLEDSLVIAENIELERGN